MRKPEQQEQARAMRREGASIRDIASATGCSKSTISRWVRDIPLSDEQFVALSLRNRDRARKVANHAWSRKNREVRPGGSRPRSVARAGSRSPAPRRLHAPLGRRFQNPQQRDLHELGPRHGGFFLEFLRRCYGVTDEQVALTINCFVDNGLTLEEIEEWWLANLDLPRSCLPKASVNRPSRASKGVRSPLLHGTARIAVSSTFVVQSIYGAIQEYVGCERPEWPDLGVRVSVPCPTNAC